MVFIRTLGKYDTIYFLRSELLDYLLWVIKYSSDGLFFFFFFNPPKSLLIPDYLILEPSLLDVVKVPGIVGR